MTTCNHNYNGPFFNVSKTALEEHLTLLCPLKALKDILTSIILLVTVSII